MLGIWDCCMSGYSVPSNDNTVLMSEHFEVSHIRMHQLYTTRDETHLKLIL